MKLNYMKQDMGTENSGARNEFFPEDSFKSLGDYGKAFMKTPFRLKDRMFTRSKDYMEIVQMKARSSHQMKKTLNGWDLIWFGIGAVVGSGIFVLTGLGAREEAGPAVVLSYAVSGISALLSVFCYTEFAVEIPVAGLLLNFSSFHLLYLILFFLSDTLVVRIHLIFTL